MHGDLRPCFPLSASPCHCEAPGSCDAGLHRIADHEDGTAVWTVLKETEVTEQLEKRAGERREEEQRHEKILETLRAELQAAREKVASLEAKA